MSITITSRECIAESELCQNEQLMAKVSEAMHQRARELDSEMMDILTGGALTCATDQSTTLTAEDVRKAVELLGQYSKNSKPDPLAPWRQLLDPAIDEEPKFRIRLHHSIRVQPLNPLSILDETKDLV